jgi:hypothetical protein
MGGPGHDSGRLRFQTYYDQLVSYKNRVGHCLVPKRHVEVEGLGHLGGYLQCIMRRRKAGTKALLPEEIEQLNMLGFQWTGGRQTSYQNIWDKNFQLLLDHLKEHGNYSLGW